MATVIKFNAPASVVQLLFSQIKVYWASYMYIIMTWYDNYYYDYYNSTMNNIIYGSTAIWQVTFRSYLNYWSALFIKLPLELVDGSVNDTHGEVSASRFQMKATLYII